MSGKWGKWQENVLVGTCWQVSWFFFRATWKFFINFQILESVDKFVSTLLICVSENCLRKYENFKFQDWKCENIKENIFLLRIPNHFSSFFCWKMKIYFSFISKCNKFSSCFLHHFSWDFPLFFASFVRLNNRNFTLGWKKLFVDLRRCRISLIYDCILWLINQFGENLILKIELEEKHMENWILFASKFKMFIKFYKNNLKNI